MRDRLGKVPLWLVACGTAVVIAAGLVGPAAAGLKYTTEYRDHIVKGHTPAAIVDYMRSHPILDPDDGPALANITHEHGLAFTTERSDNICKVSDLTFTWHFVITLPKAVDRAKMSAATASMWNEFVAKSKWHEQHRRKIFLDCGAAFVPRAEKMTGLTCWGLEGKVRHYIDNQYALCMQKQRQFGVDDRASVSNLRLMRAAAANGS